MSKKPAFRLLPVFLLTLCAVASGGEEKAPQSEAYVPADENQLFSLGAAKSPRFELKDITWPEKPGDAEVCLWKDDKYAACSITIDDNCAPDHEWWLEQCNKHGIKVTWFVITGGVDGKNKGFSGTWEGWQKLVDAGHAVQSHTTNHKKSSKEPDEFAREIYGESKYALENNLKNNRSLTMAYPYGDGNPKIAGEYYIAVRGVNGQISNANSINYLNTNKGAISQPFIDVLLTGHTDDQKLKWLNKPDKGNRRGWITPLYHYVPTGKTPEEKAASKQKAEEDVANVAKYKDRIWIDTFPAVAMYGQERDTATLKTVSSDEKKIELSLTDRMYDKVFDYPLTVKVRLPDSWKTVKAMQGDKETKATLVVNDGKPFALVDCVPDKGNIIITAE